MLIVQNRQKFFVGMEDGQLFKTKVSLRCKTDQEAIAWLNPFPECASVVKRQGDLWFAPLYATEEDVHFEVWRLLNEAEMSGGTSSYASTPAGSEYHVSVSITPSDNGPEDIGRTRHTADIVAVMHKWGSVLFRGRNGRLKKHGFQANPRVFVSGKITHPEHTTLDLNGWWEVMAETGAAPVEAGGGD